MSINRKRGEDKQQINDVDLSLQQAGNNHQKAATHFLDASLHQCKTDG